MKRLMALILTLGFVLAGCAGTPAPNTSVPASVPAPASDPTPPVATASWQDTITTAVAGATPSQAQVDGAATQADAAVRTWYEVFVSSFNDTDGDGIGDLAGVAEALDYIAYLGFNGIWLTPIFPSPTYHKYDVADYTAIDPAFGNLDIFDILIEAAEERGIAVILDFPLNHTSVEHPWFVAAKTAVAEGRMDDPHIAYYHIAPEKGSGNWEELAPGWYYECQFWGGMPDLNLSNTALRAELEAAAAFWLDRGVAGFRLDAVKEFETGNSAFNIDTLRWFNDFVKGYRPDTWLVGENWDTTSALYSYYASGVDSFFSFPFAGANGHIAEALLLANSPASRYTAALADELPLIAAQNPNGTPAPFFTNHDLPRAAGFLRRDAARIKLAWAMNLLQNGNAFVYYGEELGMAGSGKDENKRAPMYWAADAAAPGMTAGPPDMDAQAHPFPPASEQICDETSILEFVRSAVALRQSQPVLALGQVAALGLGDAPLKVGAVQKTYAGESVVLYFNLGDDAATLDGVGGTLTASLATGGTVPTLDGGTLVLPGLCIAVVAL